MRRNILKLLYQQSPKNVPENYSSKSIQQHLLEKELGKNIKY